MLVHEACIKVSQSLSSLELSLLEEEMESEPGGGENGGGTFVGGGVHRDLAGVCS